MRDPLFGSSGEPGIACSVPLSGKYTACTNYDLGSVSGDSNTYQKVSSIDPNNHVTVSYADALGRTVYVSLKSGVNSGTLTTNELKSLQYNALDKLTSMVVTDKAPQSGQSITSVTTTAQYDSLGWPTQVNDLDQGTHYYVYDADGRLLSDVVGNHTLGYNDDLLGRVGCVQDAVPTLNATGACSAGKTYVQNTYDTTELGTQGSSDFPVGHMTQSVATTYYPEGTSASTTEKFQYDKRGRSITAQLSLGLPSAWNVTTALPTYQQATTYNDADQVTTTTTSTIPSGQGFTTTLAYDSTGAPAGLSNNTSSTPDLATLVYNARAELDTINFQTSTGGALAADQFSYDANLRPTGATATWGGGSGNPSGSSIFNQSGSYDNAGNVTSLSTTQAAVPGASGSGGSETQNFCYDEQNRLVWAGNSGTQPGAGNGTCGSGMLASGLNGASYSNAYVYTHLGQLWQGPLAGGSTQYQYLYCSSQPHELSGLYAVGSTCSSKTGQGYSSSYDAFGNVTSRTFSGTTATLSYDNLNHFTEWNAGATNQEWYLYDGAGNRVLRRFTNSNGTTMIVYAFGLEEHNYSGAGAHQNDTYYYSLGGHLLGALDSNGTTFYLTDTLGSILASFSNAAGGASAKGNQVFGPYGHPRYYACCINTLKGFTGQYNDGSGLDYYNARYYDPVVGVFLSVDTANGNMAGMNPYAYVNGNPETKSDPTGRYVVGPGGQRYYPPVVPPPANNPPATNGGGFVGGGVLMKGPGGIVGGGVFTKGPPPNASKKTDVNQEDAGAVTAGKENSAHDVAETARDRFKTIADDLGNVINDPLLLFFITALGQQNKLAGTEALALILGLHYVVDMAAGLANGFADEISQGLSWFSVNNIVNKGGDILQNTVITAGKDIAIGFGIAGFGVLIAAIPGLEELGTAISAGGLTVAGLVDLAGSIFYQQANGYISQQEADIESSN